MLGLATGSTKVSVYRELVRLHQVERLSFKDVVTFNLDAGAVPVDRLIVADLSERERLVAVLCYKRIEAVVHFEGVSFRSPSSPGPSLSRDSKGEGRKSDSIGFLPGKYRHITPGIGHTLSVVLIDVVGLVFKLVAGLL